ncbi:MAG: DUF1850 domain-containing protein [Sneathiella sp.]
MKKALLNKARLLLNVTVLFAVTFNAQAVSLNIENYRSGEDLGCVDLPEDGFILSFVHSVSLTPVEDVYLIKKNAGGDLEIRQTQERFVAHGQGLPSLQNEPDAVGFKTENGMFILHLDRQIKDLIVRLDKRYKNRLDTGREITNLNQWPDDIGLRMQPVTDCEQG